MSRELKRMLSKRERAADRLVRPPVAKRKRTKPREFIKEVRGELGRVAWPNRREVVTYTIVVLVSVAFFMAVIAVMDFLSGQLVIELISRGGGS
jgi:preprotein translocase subunit SecE